MAAVIPIIAVIASVASTVYSAVSSSQAATSQEHAADRAAAAANVAAEATQAQAVKQAEAETINVQMAQDQAAQAKTAAAQKESDYRERAAAALGLERSARAGQGVTMEGTPLLTFYTNMRKYEEDAMRIREGGAVEEKGYLQQARLHGLYGQGALETGAAKVAGITDTAAGFKETASAASAANKANMGKTLLTGAMDVFSITKQAGWWGNAPITKV